MKIRITPQNLSGTVSAIPSKSVAHRALICAALSKEKTKFHNLFYSADILKTINSLKALGMEFEDETMFPHPAKNKAVLPMGESGSTFRFMLPLSMALGGRFEFSLAGRLPERPISPLYGELIKGGCTLSPEGTNPFVAEGQLKSGVYTLPGNVSSQFITGLLISLPLLSGDSEIKIEGEIESFPYIDITRDVQEKFGVFTHFENNTFYIKGNQEYKSPGEFFIEGDWSNGAFWLSANKICGNIEIQGLSEKSKQGDREIIEILEKLPTEVDARNIPDLVPIICAVASLTPGKTVIKGARRLRLKESDRILSVCETLKNLGADITPCDDGMIIKGKKTLSGGKTESYGDHRIAMMAAIASIKCTAPVIIEGAEAVEKSYPHFFEDFKALGGIYEVMT